MWAGTRSPLKSVSHPLCARAYDGCSGGNKMSPIELQPPQTTNQHNTKPLGAQTGDLRERHLESKVGSSDRRERSDIKCCRGQVILAKPLCPGTLSAPPVPSKQQPPGTNADPAPEPQPGTLPGEGFCPCVSVPQGGRLDPAPCHPLLPWRPRPAGHSDWSLHGRPGLCSELLCSMAGGEEGWCPGPDTDQQLPFPM